MATTKITDLTAYTDPVNTDVLPIVDVTSDVTKKVSIANMMKNASLGTAAAPGIAFDGDPNTGIYSPGANQLALSTNGTGRLFVDANGNVGVGSAPASTAGRSIDVNGGLLQPLLTLRATSATSATTYYTLNTIASSVDLISSDWPVRCYVNGSERLRITSTGLVGIGTSSPVSKINSVIAQADNASSSDTTLANSFLHLGGGEYGNGRYFLTTYGYSTGRTNSGAYIGAIGADATGYGKYELVFGTRNVTTDTAPTERMRIDSSGNVGIGTTSPQYKLQVSQSASAVCFGESSSVATIIGTNAAGNGSQELSLRGFPLTFTGNGGGGSEAARIDSSGRLLVGTSSDSGGALLQVNDNRIRVATAKTPASAADTGTAGEICWDADYIYVCTATNTWKRTAISTWP